VTIVGHEDHENSEVKTPMLKVTAPFTGPDPSQ
jgi:hypothetical protein